MKKILVIDDDIDMCLLLRLFLVRKGYEVIEKHSGMEALDFLQQSQVDLVISDLILGDINGIELLKRVRQKNNTLPFIMMTAHEDIEMSLSAIKHGAYNYVIKPIIPEEIIMFISQALSEKNNSNIDYFEEEEYVIGISEAGK